MRVLVVIFGGLDHAYLERWPCPHLRQAEWGPIVVDELHDGRDVATQITAQLLTGKTWRENGVLDRKKQTVTYHNEKVRWLDEHVFDRMGRGRSRRLGIWQAMGWVDIAEHEYVHRDLTCPSLFDLVEDGRSVYVPAHDPEPSWALGRNILDPRRYPDLGVDAALDLREKNFQWRRQKLFEALSEEPHDLLMAQFQYLDSTQHLFLTYHDPPRIDEVEAAYWRMDDFAAQVLDLARGRYDRVLFLSDNGAARERGTRPTHHNRPFYSVDTPLGLKGRNLRDFFGIILSWVGDRDRAACE